MAKFCSFLLVYAALILTSLSKFNHATDQLALLSFKSMLANDPKQSLSSWNNSIHFCKWTGITCSGRKHPRRVISLVLSSLGLSGSISPAIANLTFLRNIDLSNNQFHGFIPKEVGHIIQLQHLNLSMNSLQGGIPESLSNCSQLRNISMRDNLLTGKIPLGFSKCWNLRLIHLSNNSLIGNIPPSLTNLSYLKVLSLSSNELAGSIPGSIGNLHSLTYLSLANNQLSGAIPPSIGKLSKLTALGLLSNNLTGNIPSSVWNLSSLTRLSMGYNNLSGSLPQSLGQALPLIETLDLFNNQIHGALPVSLSNASSLIRIDLSFNRFSGTIPWNIGSLSNLEWINFGNNFLEAKEAGGWSFLDSLTNCTNLQVLQLDSNKLGGVLPYSITNLSTELQLLTIGDNGISGKISAEIGNLIGLTNLDLGPNLLTGSIPPSIGKLQHMHELDVNNNKLSGEIPSTLGNLTQLVAIFLDYNQLSGNIPGSLRNCQNLNLLNLNSNSLTGGIPKEILAISTLSISLSLAFNSLTGSIPLEVGNLRNLGMLDVSMNRLSGELPSSLGGCLELQELFFRGNLFHGKIPSSLSALRGIQYIDLSNNNLSGTIPEFLEEFHFLLYLNLSFNNFEGAVPRTGVFTNTSALYVSGNSKLCGGIPELNLTACPSQSLNKRHDSHRFIAIISVAGSFALLFVVFSFLVASCWMQKSRRKQLDSESMTEQDRVSYAELLRATNGFSTDNLIGSGSFAKVYKGILHEDDDNLKVIAVKVLNLEMQGASRSFLAECRALRNIRHRNLVKILTACSSTDFSGNEFKAVILDFMVNGSLYDWLHSEENEKKLDLVKRINIAIDVASALDYLHNYGEQPIVHCDLKPSNVLLDDDMTAHLGDFGLSRFLKEIASKSSQYSTSSFGLKGTIGYVPPEYGMANKVSTLGDVYSYGILVLEMFTGKSPTDDIFVDGQSLRTFVEMAFPERVADIINVKLLDDQVTDNDRSVNGSRVIKCIASVLRIGIACSIEVPAERMEIGEVINELHRIRNVLLRDGAAQLKDEGSSRTV
ncbi:receptor kinase-like protein Xa21 [Asparagus officinalis]|uniref:receptor kinase-like protein Xa21 n=1 Tax=Asparagus officinalis TaxID=4686 RepID=UPI00098E019E|nr:receptor kinase-like protein Xa21 [Asparagus officinalis]